jgi:hypothetical protein
MTSEPPFDCRVCRDIGAPFHRAVEIVMNETACDVEQRAVDALWALIDAGWTVPNVG